MSFFFTIADFWSWNASHSFSISYRSPHIQISCGQIAGTDILIKRSFPTGNLFCMMRQDMCQGLSFPDQRAHKTVQCCQFISGHVYSLSGFPKRFTVLLMGIISVIQVLIKQTADGLGAVIAHIRRLVFYWAWCIHKVRTQLIAADTLPAWNSALMSLLLFTHIPTPAAISVFTPVGTCMKYAIPVSQLMITMPAYFLGNRIR